MRPWLEHTSENRLDSCRERYVWAPSAALALVLIGHPDANAYSLPDDVKPDDTITLKPKARSANCIRPA